MENNKWSDIGYHYCIAKEYRIGDMIYHTDGELVLGRPVFKPGAGVRGFNQNSIHICLLGEFKFTKKQFETLYYLSKNLLSIFSLNLESIIPHNSLNPMKGCPNFSVERWKDEYFGDSAWKA